MLKKFARFIILSALRLTVLVLVCLFISPYLLDSMKSLASMAITLDNTRLLSFLFRGFAYIVLFFSWPHLIKKLIQHPSLGLRTQVKKARSILMGALLSIESLYWVGHL